MNDDKRLAALCYIKAGIPMSEWPDHWRLDTNNHGRLTHRARRAYLAIWRSTRAV